MGAWTPHETVYGMRERWVPAAPGDWPTYTDPGSLREGMIPPPCATCGGELIRHLVSNAEAVEARHQRRMRIWNLQSKNKGPEPTREALVERYVYIFNCLPEAHRPPPVAKDNAMELRPHDRV